MTVPTVIAGQVKHRRTNVDQTAFRTSPRIARCFEVPTERFRTKQILASQELLFPRLYSSIQTAMLPLMSISRTGVENQNAQKMAMRLDQKSQMAMWADDDPAAPPPPTA